MTLSLITKKKFVQLTEFALDSFRCAYLVDPDQRSVPNAIQDRVADSNAGSDSANHKKSKNLILYSKNCRDMLVDTKDILHGA